MPKLLRGAENAIKHDRGTPLKVDGLATAIFRVALAFDPTILLQSVEDSGQRRFFDPDTGRDLTLGQLVATARKMGQRPPLAHAQAKGLQTLVKLRPPDARGLVQEEAQLLDIAFRHEIVSMLTIPRKSTPSSARAHFQQNDFLFPVIHQP